MQLKTFECWKEVVKTRSRPKYFQDWTDEDKYIQFELVTVDEMGNRVEENE